LLAALAFEALAFAALAFERLEPVRLAFAFARTAGSVTRLSVAFPRRLVVRRGFEFGRVAPVMLSSSRFALPRSVLTELVIERRDFGPLIFPTPVLPRLDWMLLGPWSISATKLSALALSALALSAAELTAAELTAAELTAAELTAAELTGAKPPARWLSRTLGGTSSRLDS
jgi:hypothetical protein